MLSMANIAKIVLLIIAILTLNLFYYNFSTTSDLAFCSLIMFIIEVIYADKNIKKFSFES